MNTCVICQDKTENVQTICDKECKCDALYCLNCIERSLVNQIKMHSKRSMDELALCCTMCNNVKSGIFLIKLLKKKYKFFSVNETFNILLNNKNVNKINKYRNTLHSTESTISRSIDLPLGKPTYYSSKNTTSVTNIADNKLQYDVSTQRTYFDIISNIIAEGKKIYKMIL